MADRFGLLFVLEASLKVNGMEKEGAKDWHFASAAFYNPFISMVVTRQILVIPLSYQNRIAFGRCFFTLACTFLLALRQKFGDLRTFCTIYGSLLVSFYSRSNLLKTCG